MSERLRRTFVKLTVPHKRSEGRPALVEHGTAAYVHRIDAARIEYMQTGQEPTSDRRTMVRLVRWL